ncbi:MAG TPA: DUF3108 domain-containing protein [Calditrichia bacterium]|nr:DUF3108 domain-containing protein [Calditrichota bacterium]HQU74106.1 DUF3108 domain-containing protein [Calditrichia bacterium]HQV32775.1 DUF3108 domain-containing protein [Calditrichia bacterium]
MSFMKRLFFSTFLLFSVPLFAQDPVAPDSLLSKPFQWSVGEELFYRVKYTFFTVGKLHFQVLKEDTIRGRKVYHCKMHMEDSGRIPFLDIDDSYDSFIDAEEVYTHRFWAYEKQSDHYLFTYYDFNYEENKIEMVMEKLFENDTLRVLDSTAVLDRRVQDGLSLLFYARANAFKAYRSDTPVFAFNDYQETYINFSGREEEVEVTNQDTDGWYLDGKMKFVGIAGLKEGFRGWFSRDPQRVPLHAHMKAIVGSVKLYLEDWKAWQGGDYLLK